MFALFGDPQHSITDQVLKAYEYQDNWTNRMILDDSLVVMNSLLHYEGLGGQVQMTGHHPRERAVLFRGDDPDTRRLGRRWG